MGNLQFQPPPEWLIQAYMNKPQPAEIANQGIGQAIQGYATAKDTQQKEALAQQAKDIEMAKGLAGNGQDFLDAYKQVIAARTPPAKVPFATPRAPTALGGSMNPDTVNPQANEVSPFIAHSVNVMGHPDITGHLAQAPSGFEPPTPSTGTVPSPMTMNIATDPMIQEYQKDPLAFKKQHGATGMTKLKTQAELDKLMTEKGNTPYYDAKGNKQFELPPGSKLIPGTTTSGGKTFIGNDSEGNPLFADKAGTITPGNVPNGGPVLPKSSTMPTSATRSSAEFADTILPHIQSMRDLIAQADKAGYIGPAAGRVYGKFLAGQVGSTGDPKADQLLGQLRATDSLVKTGAMKVHFGSRGGGQMYDHFSDLLNSGQQSAAMLNGSLDALQSFMEGYSKAGKPGGGGNAGNGPKVGTVENGYKFKGGNPADKTSWIKQ